ncbi:MAG: histidine phosphatase family protein [Betaproteobacteria bacterium]|nr:MAG: histidine phosphatase family protein [Betaproteobacteria bacterium]
MTQIILIRHGETVWNQQRRMQGHSDSPLSETGVRQARLLARHLKQIAFSVLYSSDSGRAQHTARSVSEVTGHDIVLEPRLRERHFGVFEGLTGSEIEAQYPADYARFKSRDQAHVIPGGESGSAFRARVLGCLHEIAGRHAGELVVVITHGLVLDVLYRKALGIAPELPRIHELVNAGINRLRYDGGAWHIEVWGDGSHLDESLLTSA